MVGVVGSRFESWQTQNIFPFRIAVLANFGIGIELNNSSPCWEQAAQDFIM